MKPKSTLRSFLLLAGSTLLAVSYTQAATLYWDGTDTTANADGGAGTWDTTTPNWDSAAIGGTAATWSNGTPDSAVFGGTAGIVTPGENITVGGLQFDTTAFQISTGASTVSLGAANNTVTLNNIALANLTGKFGGTGNVSFIASVPTTAGEARFNGTSTGGWSGSTTIGAGATVGVLSSNQALLNTSAITLNGGGIRLTNIDSTQGAIDRVSNSAGITSNGGTITYTNTSGADVYAETLGSVALTSGALNVVLTNNQASTGSQTLTLSGLTRTGASNTSTVAFSAGVGLNATKNILPVSGATATPAGEIVGPWATTGTTAAAQTRWAVYDASGNILPDTIADTAEASWVDSTTNAWAIQPVTSSLTNNRTAGAVRIYGGAGTWTLPSFSLQTYGVFFSGANLITIAATGTGALTTPTGGGALYLTSGQTGHTISAPVNDNGGAVTLVKSGSGLLLLNSTSSNYSGGTVINSGELRIASDAALGSSSGSITLNGGTLRGNTTNPQVGNGGGINISSAREVIVGAAGGTIAVHGNNSFTTTGKLSGSSIFTASGTSGDGGRSVNFNSTVNDFTGRLVIQHSGTATITLSMNSLVDSANNIAFVSNSTAFAYGTGATSALTLDNRAFEINSGSAVAATISNLNTTYPLTVNRDLVATGAGAKTLALSAASGPTNVFSGAISDGTGGGTVALTKSGNGTWTLSGNNTHSAGTTLSVGTLNINSATALGTGTFTIGAATFNNTSGSAIVNANNNVIAWNGDGTFTGANDLNLGTGNVTLGGNRNIGVSGSKLTFGGVVSGAFGINKNAGSGTLVLANTSNTYTGNTTIAAGTMEITSIADYSTNSSMGAPASGNLTMGGNGSTGTLNYIGGAASSNRTIQVGNATAANAGNARINNNSTTGALTFTATNFNSTITGITATRTLTLGGSYIGGNNEIQGVIQDNTASTGKLNLAKADASTWVLSGTNTYTGTTSVNGGTLSLGSTGSIATSASVSIAAGATLDTSGQASYAIPTGKTVTFGIDATGSGSSGKITASGLDITNATVTYNIIGTPDDTVYILATYTPGQLTGTNFATVDAPPAGYTLNYAYEGNKIALVQATSTPFQSWAGGALFNDDANGDGVKNGLAWILGAADKTVSALNKLPTAGTPAGYLTLSFNRVNPYAPAKLYIEYSNNLSTWTKLEIPAVSGTIPSSDVEVVVTPGTPDAVTVKIPTATHASGGKLFGRLSSTEN